MLSCLWNVGLILASLWGPGEFFDTTMQRFSVPDAGLTVPSGAYLPVPVEQIGIDFNDAAPVVTRTKVLPPIKAGECPTCDEPPDRDEILRALPPTPPSISYVYNEYRDNFEFIVEKLVDRVDLPRFVPLLGPVQLHHCHWKCTVHFHQTIDAGYPFTFKVRRSRTEVVYIDRDQFHLCGTGWETEFAQETGVQPRGCPTGGKAGPKVAKRSEGNAETSEPPTAVPARTERSSRLNLDDVIALSKNRLSPRIIIRQMENTNSTFELTVDDLIRLAENGVDEEIICAMQERR